MILKKEIQNKSAQWGVPPDIVDKDWVLGHFLSAMFSFENFRKVLVFKGGTALRKCFFSQYRFSEDLDFTALDPDYGFSMIDFEDIITTANKNSGVLFYPDNFKELKFEDKLTGYEIKLKYWGANHSKNQEPPDNGRWATGIKVEIILYEQIVFEPVMKKIIHPYSDVSRFKDIMIPCYDLKEVMSEKLRALIQRSYTAPRDFYDIYSLSDSIKISEWKLIRSAFEQKTRFKGYDPESIEKVFNDSNLKSVKKAWENSIRHQVPQHDFPGFEYVLNKVKNIIEKYIKT